jgi:hypothetical protein
VERADQHEDSTTNPTNITYMSQHYQDARKSPREHRHNIPLALCPDRDDDLMAMQGQTTLMAFRGYRTALLRASSVLSVEQGERWSIFAGQAQLLDSIAERAALATSWK